MVQHTTGQQYSEEPVRFAGLEVIDLAAESKAVSEAYRNQVLNKVNESCLRLAVFQGEYRWHVHPTSDELFIILEGAMVIEFRDRPPLRLGPLQAATVPAGIEHRTVGVGRTVNLCFEKLRAETVFLD